MIVAQRQNNMHRKLLIYTAFVFALSALIVLAMINMHQKTGAIPYTVAAIFYFGLPILVWLLPIYSLYVGAVYWWRQKAVAGHIGRRWLSAILGGCAYCAAAIGIIILIYSIWYPK